MSACIEGGSRRDQSPPELPLPPFEAEQLGPVLWLSGELDMATADLLQEALEEAADRTDGDLLVNLSRTSFMGAAAIRPLLCVQAKLREQHRDLTIVDTSRSSRLLLAVPTIARALEGLCRPERS